MKQEVTIVTVFFPIGRDEWKEGVRGSAARSDEKYIEYFSFWARMRNKVIIYTDAAHKDAIMKIREGYGLGDRTTIVTIDDIYALDHEVYDAMERVTSKPEARAFRADQNCAEVWNAKYDYIMYLKYYFVKKSIDDGLASGMVAWFDFGFNKGGAYYIDKNDFDFTWEVDLSPKIHLFKFFPDVEKIPIFEIVRTMKVMIAGEMVLAPANLWEEILPIVRRAELSLTDCDFADDDQTVLLMAYRAKPEIFELHYADFWMESLSLTTDHPLKIEAKRKHKRVKHLAQRNMKEKKYGEAIKNYIDYARLKMKGE